MFDQLERAGYCAVHKEAPSTHEETALESEGRRARAVDPGVVTSRIAQQEPQCDRAIAHIDGFNLYNGVKAKYGRRYLWLDVQRLAASLLKPEQVLVGVRYCTSRLRDDQGKMSRQGAYLWALAEHCDKVEIVEGRFGVRQRRCRVCGATWLGYEEKETDVNLATGLVEDAAQGKYDVALLISADSDLCPAVRAVKRLRPGARVVACFPPQRWSEDLRRTVDGFLMIGEDKLRGSQLPERVTTSSGKVLERPKKWR